ncbi:hypothetical protein [Cellulomonas composti]|uniref:Uncharacterized protein n=1 Tax=Cellulomonas composti TaxID=266130 RepID=A0A511JAK7_9CELL|nr:hypothetical protein [Cellulomonas composti]GEL95017.1 hypothetical protein CCO02nite_16750 [Cellulomonas composti]
MSTPRRSRRAIRPAGTVGPDDAPLRSTLPALEDVPAAPVSAPEPDESDDAGAPASSGASRSDDALLQLRGADDSDVGWGSDGDANDARLQRDKPPHW